MRESGGTRSIRGLTGLVMLMFCLLDHVLVTRVFMLCENSANLFHQDTCIFLNVYSISIYIYIFKQEISTKEWFYLNYQVTSPICICCMGQYWQKRGGKIQVYLNKWHLQIFNSKNNLMLPGWLAVWEHMDLKLATWFINTWTSKSIKKARMQITDDWYLSDRWFLLLIRMMMRRISYRSNQTEIKGDMQTSSPQRRRV